MKPCPASRSESGGTGSCWGTMRRTPGEITLTDCWPGTYRVQEVDTGDSGHVLTPQEIELKAGDGIKELHFFNDQSPESGWRWTAPTRPR